MTDLAATLSDPQEATAERLTGTFGNLFYASSVTQWWVPLGILVVWQVSSSAGWLPTRFLPAPLDILAAAYKVTVNGDLPKNIAVSFQRAVSGFLLGGSIAFALGLANGLSETSETFLDSTLQDLGVDMPRPRVEARPSSHDWRSKSLIASSIVTINQKHPKLEMNLHQPTTELSVGARFAASN